MTDIKPEDAALAVNMAKRPLPLFLLGLVGAVLFLALMDFITIFAVAYLNSLSFFEARSLGQKLLKGSKP